MYVFDIMYIYIIISPCDGVDTGAGHKMYMYIYVFDIHIMYIYIMYINIYVFDIHIM